MVVAVIKLIKNSAYGFIIALLGYFNTHLTFATDSSDLSGQCTPPASSLAQLKKQFSFPRLEQDFSCFTDIPSLGKSLSSYQLVDMRKPKSRDSGSVTNAWTMELNELSHKSFLKNKNLLLLGEGFSRVNGAYACNTLRKQDFTKVKILIGGVDAWAAHTVSKNKAAESRLVQPQDFIYEYFNGKLVVIASSNEISSRLHELGLSNVYALKTSDLKEITNVAVSQSANGFDPVVIVGDDNINLDVSFDVYPNLYKLVGGVGGLAQQMNLNLLAEHNRSASQEGRFCGSN